MHAPSPRNPNRDLRPLLSLTRFWPELAAKRSSSLRCCRRDRAFRARINSACADWGDVEYGVARACAAGVAGRKARATRIRGLVRTRTTSWPAARRRSGRQEKFVPLRSSGQRQPRCAVQLCHVPHCPETAAQFAVPDDKANRNEEPRNHARQKSRSAPPAEARNNSIQRHASGPAHRHWGSPANAESRERLGPVRHRQMIRRVEF